MEVPFTSEHLNLNNFSLVRYANGGVIENCFAKAKFHNEEGFTNGIVRLQALEAGNYELNMRDQGINIQVNVHRGTYWETDSFILKTHSLVELRENQNFIRVSHVGLKDSEGGQKLTFKLNNYKSNPRVHFYAFTFMPNNVYELYRQLRSNPYAATLSVFKFHQWKNFYLSNRKLGDEFRYVFDRKYVKRFMGNMLNTPSLLLKRAFVRDTTFNEEVVNAGAEF